tara:strand:- start:10060 stop:10773 length:714 start_codon:yes stop_codon:yes gene_type:complete
MSDFTEKVIIITGAGGNLGNVVAKHFFSCGANLSLIDFNSKKLNDVKLSLEDDRRVMGHEVDLSDKDSVEKSIEATIKKFKKIDILLNIAGGFEMGPKIQDTSDAMWSNMFNLNIQSIFFTCRASLPHMLINQGGSIVNISARAALNGKSNMGAYCASKAAVKTLTESLAEENKSNNINVNCILPGTLDTPENRLSMPDADFENWVPLSAISNAISFLVSDDAKFITGASIPVYGKS